MKNKIKKFIKNNYNYLIFLFVAVITIYIIRKEVNLEEFMSVINHSNIFYLFLSLCLLGLYWVIETGLLLILIRYEYPNASFKTAFTIVIVGQYYNQVTPSSSGGQPMQLLELMTSGVKAGTGIAILVQKYALYQIAITTIGIAGILTNLPLVLAWPGYAQLFLLFGLVFNIGGVVLILLVTFKPKLAEKFLYGLLNLGLKLHIVKNEKKWSDRIKQFVFEYSTSVKKLTTRLTSSLILVFFNIIAILIFYLITYTILKALGIPNINIFEILMLQALCYLMIAFVPLPGAAGGAEIGFVLVFSTLLGSAESSVALLAWRFITFYFIIFFGAVYIAIHELRRGKKKKLDS